MSHHSTDAVCAVPILSTPLTRRNPGLRPTVLAAAMHVALVSGLMGAWATEACAQAVPGRQATATRIYDIPAGPLDAVLTQFVTESGVPVAASPEQVRGKRSPGVNGSYSTEAALRALLTGTELQAVSVNGSSYTVRQMPVDTSSSATLPTVVVTDTASKSEDRLPAAYAGGQVGREARLGLLGNRSFMDIPFNIMSVTAAAMQDQQARSIADVVLNDPSVRVVSPQTNGSEVFNIRGFSVSNQDVSFDGLYGILPYWRGSVASAERVTLETNIAMRATAR